MNILIFGSSFSGSTVLSGMLGAHSQIETLGEVYQWYLWHRGSMPDRPNEYFRRETLGATFLEGLTYCRSCGESCPHWSTAPGLEGPKDLYSKLRSHFGARFIVDSSKHAHWFSHIIPKCTGDNYRIVLLHKPVWCMLTSRARYMGLNSSDELPPDIFENNVEFWCQFYRGFRNIIQHHGMQHAVTNVRYEDLVGKPIETIQRIISPIGLEYEPGMELGFNLKHHEIAGNSKLLTNVTQTQSNMPLVMDSQHNEASFAVRQRALDYEDARELMQWLGRTEEIMSVPGGHVKIHVGCGKRHISGWLNVDVQNGPGVDLVRDTRHLAGFPDGCASIVYACTVLEHFSKEDVPKVLSEWFRVLRAGGILRVSVPDFKVLAKIYLEGYSSHILPEQIDLIKGMIVGGQKDQHDFHKEVFDEARLRRKLEQAGFVSIMRYDWRQTDHADVDDYSQAYLPHMDKENGVLTSLNMEATKP